MHSAYGSGHATIAGACGTMLKALFNEEALIQSPVMPDPTDPSGQRLVAYTDTPLTVGGEINKLVSNISQARNIAGVHWRTDANNANVLGQAVTYNLLRDMNELYFENLELKMQYQDFDGNEIVVPPWP